jgi:hypothetical protein
VLKLKTEDLAQAERINAGVYIGDAMKYATTKDALKTLFDKNTKLS